MSYHDTRDKLQTVSNDLAYSVAQTLAEAVSVQQIGDQDWQNEFYSAVEYNFDNFIADVLAEVGDPPETES